MAAKFHFSDLRHSMRNMHMPELHQNMGTTDRVIRAAIGTALVMNWVTKDKPSLVCKIGGIIGSAFLVYGVSGWDPVLHALRTNTYSHDTENVVNKLRSARHNGGAKAVRHAQERGKRLLGSRR